MDLVIHCCLCRAPRWTFGDNNLEPTDLPGTGYRCIDHDACAERVREIVSAHQGLAEVCEVDGDQSGPKVARNVIPAAKRGCSA